MIKTRRWFLKTSIAGGILINSGCNFNPSRVVETPPTDELDGQTRAFLDKTRGGTPLHTQPIAEARETLERVSRSFGVALAEVHATEDRTIPGPAGPIPIRVYSPTGGYRDEQYPILLLFHGGGFVLGSINTHDSIARYFCKHANVLVVSVDYRLAPENKFPAGIEDSYAALCWASANGAQFGGDVSRLAVIGDSAGGSIAAVVCQLAKLRDGPKVAYQVLLYPAVTSVLETTYPSRKLYGNGEYFLTKEFKQWQRHLYFENANKQQYDVMASPILTEDMSALPQALVITAGFDMLRDEAKHYAGRLIESHVPIEYKNYPTIHGFISFASEIDLGKAALDYVSDRLKLVFS